MTDPLFQPITINGLTVKNRIAMPAMLLNMARDFEVTEPLLEFYAERARGGAGMITVGYATVDGLSGDPRNIGAHEDAFVPGLTRLAAAISDNGARASVQLNHAGRYVHSSSLGGRQPVAPSAVASRLTRETPRALSVEEIREIVRCFAQAARRVREAGFDAVEVLAGTGYLISEFLSPLTNQRDDEYGGRFENRIRFALDVIRAVRGEVGRGFPLIMRISGDDFMAGGVGRREREEFAVRLVREGVDALSVNAGWHEARVPQTIAEVPRGAFAYLSRRIAELVEVPVIASHRINDPDTARKLIADGACDMVAMARALIADPWLPEKARTGREEEILHCVACGQGCFDNLFQMRPVECLCNPEAGHEGRRAVAHAGRALNVLVVGGGPAGMSAAAAAARRGHTVTLIEKSGRLGGQLHLAGAPPGRKEFVQLAHDLAGRVARLGVNVVLGREADGALLDAERPGAIILATGGVPIVPSIPGAELPHVVQAWDVLAGKVSAGRRVVLIGGGAVGVETALFLAEKGTLSGEALKFLLVHGAASPEELYELAVRGTKEVVIIELLGELGTGFGRTTRWAMLQDVERRGVNTYVAAQDPTITRTSVRIGIDGADAHILGDTVVLAVGTRSHNPLQQLVERMGIPFRVVGDAFASASALDAVHQGFAAGTEIG
jgi:2,4-dienoyl-CoA reductase (NADPH2)